MKVIHQGTQIVSSFSMMDDDGNVLQTVNVKPAKQVEGQIPQDDPLRFPIFNEASFVRAYQTILKVRQDMEKQAEENKLLVFPSNE